jgi:hypothetical protein
MRACVIAEGETFKLTSYGNGWAYALEDKAARLSVYVQDDDASQFRREWDGFEFLLPNAGPDEIAGRMWSDLEYSVAAAPVGG